MSLDDDRPATALSKTRLAGLEECDVGVAAPRYHDTRRTAPNDASCLSVMASGGKASEDSRLYPRCAMRLRGRRNARRVRRIAAADRRARRRSFDFA